MSAYSFEECVEWSKNYKPDNGNSKEFWMIIGGLTVGSLALTGIATSFLSSSSDKSIQEENNRRIQQQEENNRRIQQQEENNRRIQQQEENNRRMKQQEEINRRIQQQEEINRRIQQERQYVNQEPIDINNNNLIQSNNIIIGDDGVKYELVE